MTKIKRKINWISSVLEGEKIESLELSLIDFYSNNPTYYSDIDFTSNNWISESEPGYGKIINLSVSADSICEIGCGNANILKYYPELMTRYTGLDFSEKTMNANLNKYSKARFIPFKLANQFPVSTQEFDLVFSVFVLEHVSRPADFLNECKRILKPGGKLVILCPDFLGRGRMSSQRAGFSAGTTSQKLKRGKIIDAIVTLFDNRIRIPFVCQYYRFKAAKYPLFLINTLPVVFEDEFQPDVDAVYLTNKNEICDYLKNDFKVLQNDPAISKYEVDKKIIFLQLLKPT